MIRLSSVAVGYGQGIILDNIDLHIAPGSFHFLTGPSGSGKSTLFRLLTMELEPRRGRMEIFGRPAARLSAERVAEMRRRIGIVHQDNPMLDHLTVWDNIAVPLLVLGKKAQDFQDDVTDLLQWVGLGDRMSARPTVLSGGEKQRAGIARAVIGKPELLLADEPTSSVEPQMARRLLQLFIELNRLGTSVIIATHDHAVMRLHPAPRIEIVNRTVRVV
ncbi:MAG: ATP-binding cassette domain-containing protein [Hyphomicrobiaceae bacterium]|nr:ATP-binding cassette domain-containing protein [Hyphomicrobiaceae bacterium]